MRSKTKEIVVVLPNRDELPAGKTKDESKLLSLITAEYGLGQDISFFQLQKQKNKFLLKLVFIPTSVGDLHSNNAKKFVMFELIRSEINSVLHTDDDLNKRAAAILDLVNNDDPNAKETIRAKLSAIIDVSGELEHILDLLLTDVQFNSFKYTVLNNNKSTSLLCVNTSGIYLRSIEVPFDVQDSAIWVDIKDVTYKNKKLSIHRNYGQATEVTFLNKKAANLAHHHLRQYLVFLGTRIVPEPTNWFGRISQRIRKSFSRRSAVRPPTDQVHCATSEKPVSSTSVVQLKSTAPSIIPESSFISEDVMDNPISIVEPSLKTNSTYDVSLGSDNSYRPTITSLSNEELSNNGDKLSSFHKPSGQYNDDHVSLKTTSTYEVSLDSRQLVKPISTDNESGNAGGQLYSFGASSSRTSPPLILQTKKDVAFNERDKSWNRSPIAKPEEPFSATTDEPNKDKSWTRPPIIKPEEPIIISEEKSMKVTLEQSSTSFSLSSSGQLTTQVEQIDPSCAFAPNRQVEIVAQVSHELKSELSTQSSSLSYEAISEPPSIRGIAAENINALPHSPMRSSNKVIPEPPIRMTSEPTNVIEDDSKDAMDKQNKVIPGPIVKGIAIQDLNKKLSMAIEPIKEEETLAQSNEMIPRPDSDSLSHGAVSATTSLYSPTNEIVADNYTEIVTETTNIPFGDCSKPDHDWSPHNEVKRPYNFQETVMASEECNPGIFEDKVFNKNEDFKSNDRPEMLELNEKIMESNIENSENVKLESKLPMSRQRSIPSPKVQRPSRIPAKSISSPKEETSSFIPVKIAQSPSDKENYQNDKNSEEDQAIQESKCSGDRPSTNFSRFETQEYKVDSKTTFTSVSTIGDNIVKKSTQTEISSIKSTGIPTPVTKQYKSTTTITSTIKKPADIPKSPSNSATKIPTGIPRMSSK